MTVTAFVNGVVDRGDGSPDDTQLLVNDGSIADPERSDVRPDRIVDLRGRYLAPAFGDGHAHLLLAGQESLGPRISGVDSIEGILAEVGKWARSYPDAEWIIGGSYNGSLVPKGRFDARWLDSVESERPVMLRAWDYHTLWCNTRALEIAGITSDSPEHLDIGEIPRRSDGSVLGILAEWEAEDLLWRVAPPIGIESGVRAIEIATSVMASHGITWVQDAWIDPTDVPIWVEAARRDKLRCRVDLALRADPLRWEQQKSELDSLRGQVEGVSDRLTCHTVKFFVDGVVENHTAFLLEDYADQPGRGLAVMDQSTLSEAAAFVDRLGFEIHMHAIGDAAVRGALDAMRYVRERNGERDRRWTIAHAQLVSPEDRVRFQELGVIACFQPLWAQQDGLMTVLSTPHLGQVRSDQQYPLRTIARTGAHVSFGSDWPCSTPDMLEEIRVACTRRTASGYPDGGWVPDERLSVTSALAAARSGVAYQAGAEQLRGMLRPGMQADLVVMTGDPRVVDPMEIAEIRVAETWVAGQCSYRSVAEDSVNPV